jgi:hypothetical protein
MNLINILKPSVFTTPLWMETECFTLGPHSTNRAECDCIHVHSTMRMGRTKDGTAGPCYRWCLQHVHLKFQRMLCVYQRFVGIHWLSVTGNPQDHVNSSFTKNCNRICYVSVTVLCFHYFIACLEQPYDIVCY